MRRTLPLAVLLLLGGCGLFGARGPAIPPEENTPEHQACRAAARNSPEVRALARELNPNNAFNDTRLDGEIRAAQARAYRACLRERGLAPPGGVEPLAPPR